jgi:DNA modification methylase
VLENLSKSLAKALDNKERANDEKVPKSFGFYWTRKNVSQLQNLLEEFAREGQVVLDPFLGSGSLAIAAALAKDKTRFVGIELNEMPMENLKATFGIENAQIRAELADCRKYLLQIANLYSFTTTSGKFIASKFVHDIVDGNFVTQRLLGTLDGKKVELGNSSNQALFEEVALQYQLRVQGFAVRNDSALAENSRIAIKSGMFVSDIFGPLGFEALSIMRNLAVTSKAARLVIGAGLHLCRLTDAKSQSQFPFWHPKKSVHEKSVHEVLEKKIKELENRIDSPIGNSEIQFVSDFGELESANAGGQLLIQGDSTRTLREMIPDGVVDLVITDPPYFDQVAYSEYLKLWEFFTCFESNLGDEIVESSRVGANKGRSSFLEDLGRAFEQVRRTMKEGALALVFFKDSKPRNLHDFIETLERSGLKYQSQVHLPKSTYTYKQNTSQENTVGGDSIMIFIADTVGGTSHSVRSNSPQEHLDAYFLDLLGEYIILNGPSSLTEALDNSLIAKLYPTGYLRGIRSSSHFAEVAKRMFDFDTDSRKWSSKSDRNQ